MQALEHERFDVYGLALNSDACRTAGHGHGHGREFRDTPY